MKPINENELIINIDESRLKLSFKEETAVIEPAISFILITIDNKDRNINECFDLSYFRNGKFYLIGREPCSPFNNIEDDKSIRKISNMIDDSRCLELESCNELLYVLESLKSMRVSVENDFYVFSSNNSFLIYASHHDEIIFYSLDV